jgi:radical SAM superfamily enzyme YgiQ (UPF0313 family)
MNALLVQPIPPARVFPRGAYRNMHVPTGLAYVASALQRAGHTVRVLAREEQLHKHGCNRVAADEDLRRLLRSFHPDLVGLAVLSPSLEDAAEVARWAKELCGSATRVIAGGVHPTVLGSEMLAAMPELDAAVVGEGEATLVELAAGKPAGQVAGTFYREDGRVLSAPPRPPLRDLDALEPIDYGLFDMAYYTAPSRWLIRWLKLSATNLRTSRGCTNACQFCAGTLVSGLGVRFHSPEFVVEQMERVVKGLGVKAIHFEDDTLGADPDRLARLCAAIRRLGLETRVVWDGCLRVDQVAPELLAEMKAAGCIQIEYGFETASDRTLSLLGKGSTVAQNRRAVELTRKAGLRIFADIMMGLPEETAADLRATREFVRWAAPEVLSFGQMSFLPGSPMFRRLSETQRAAMDYADTVYPEGAAGINLTAMSDAELARQRREMFRYWAIPCMKRQFLRDSTPADEPERRQWRRELRRFMLRHPLRYARLPRGPVASRRVGSLL